MLCAGDQDEPLSYLSALRDDVVRLYAAAHTVPKSNQDIACVVGAGTARGRVATTLLKAVGFQVLAVPDSTEDAAVVQADNRADHVHALAGTNLVAILRAVGVDALKIYVHCSHDGSSIESACRMMAPDGLIVSWTAAEPAADLQVPLASLAEAQVSFKAIGACGPAPGLHEARSIVRDIFRKHTPPNVLRIEQGFENLASAFATQTASEFVVVQVEPELPQPNSTVLPEAVELHRFIAEADIALRSVITVFAALFGSCWLWQDG